MNTTNQGVAESGDDLTQFSTIYQSFRTLIHPALMQRANEMLETCGD
ncbi:MAG: hypothetical protein HRU34_20910 [Richelia sp.]|nr:hypothetical protein [Richelia sp.]CDN14281.1 Transporter [Richelia intracellularis]